MKTPKQSHYLMLALAVISMHLTASAQEISPFNMPDNGKPPLPNGSLNEMNALPWVVQARKEVIEQALDNGAGGDWNGRYHQGGGYENVLLLISSDAGVSAEWHGCMGLYGANEGSVLPQPEGKLKLDFNWRNATQAPGGFPEELTPILWGNRHYLLAPNDFIEFVNAIHHDQESNNHSYGFFFLRDGDEKLRVFGKPNLPAPYLSLIRDEPLIATVTHSKRIDSYTTEDGECINRLELEFDIPPDSKWVAGIKLDRIDVESSYRHATVIDSFGSRAKAQINDFKAPCSSDAELLTVGWKFSTGSFSLETEASNQSKCDHVP